MKRFVSILLVWLVIVLALNGIIHVSLNRQPATGPGDLTGLDTSHELYHVIDEAHRLARDKEYLAALNLLEKAHAAFANLPHAQNRLLYEYYQLKGHCHAALWQYIEAEGMWRQAGEYAVRADDRKRMRDLVQMSRRAINDMNHERDKHNVYHASPRIGPAAMLRGKVVLIYVFLTDAVVHEWSLRERTHTLNTWSLVQQWLSSKAKSYASDVTFSQRVFVINKHPVIKRLKVGDQASHYQNAENVARLAARQFGYDSILAFINQIKKEEHADQAILIYHIAKEGRSFASRCMHSCDDTGEFVFLMETPSVKHWQSLRYTQAHESLHLFGADDLYNIKNAKYYAVHDIMNYPSSVLDASTLEELTAYSVGLSKRRPITPFKVITSAPGRF